MIPSSPLPGEGTQVYFRKRRAWEDAQTPISRALARPTATLRSELLRRIPAPQLRAFKPQCIEKPSFFSGRHLLHGDLVHPRSR